MSLDRAYIIVLKEYYWGWWPTIEQRTTTPQSFLDLFEVINVASFERIRSLLPPQPSNRFIMQFQDAAKLSRSPELGQTLHNLNRNRYPHVPNPPGCKKRASVALIIRVRPTFPDTATFDTSTCGLAVRSDQERLNAFFAQGWVQRGDPEVLFIKRAARKGDRWTSHIAFPGGGKDPGDKDDLAASIRETREEVGMELEADHCLNVGNLSERVVTAWLGKTPYVLLASPSCF